MHCAMYAVDEKHWQLVGLHDATATLLDVETGESLDMPLPASTREYGQLLAGLQDNAAGVSVIVRRALGEAAIMLPSVAPYGAAGP